MRQNDTRLGAVYLRVSSESWGRRGTRYVGIALIVIMASLLVAVSGTAYASVSRAHVRLRDESA
ncbi:hypothetical protein [Sphingomonas sp.]|uniref:hypothetical protein n=1 Tax=Sphingomonas sp. TaxID=28214 RepID=UPI002ED78612